jgi:hypothetical protein
MGGNQINQNSSATINQLGRTNFKNNLTCGNITQNSGGSVLKDVNCGF